MHKTVLLHETVQGLNPRVGGVYIDGTLNTGGHSKLLAKLVGKKGTIIGMDADNNAFEKRGE